MRRQIAHTSQGMALPSAEKLGRLGRAFVSAVMVLLATVVFVPFREHLRPTEVALTLVLVVLLTSTFLGSTAGLAAAVIGILSFNFFFLPPYDTFTITGAENWVAFGTFLITAVVAGQLSGYARRRAEESEARKREIERLYDEFRAAFEKASEAEALRRSDKLKSALLDAVTHDLRTPLTSIKASVTTLLDDAAENVLDEESRQEFLEIIDEETDRLDGFTASMVAIAKVEANALNLRRSSTSVEEVITNAAERAAKMIGDRDLTINIQPDIPNVFADAVSVSQVIFTLLDNASRYSPAGSRIAVTAEQQDGSVLISVQNEGHGIAPDMRERVFEKFVRGHGEDIHRTGGGLGLGLAIARGIIESQEGTLRYEDPNDVFAVNMAVRLPSPQQPRNAETNIGHR